jgi:hypothetical protein
VIELLLSKMRCGDVGIATKIVQILVDRLIILISDSLDNYPRERLFINTKGNKASQDTLKDWLNDIIKINIPNLRSSHISYWYP